MPEKFDASKEDNFSEWFNEVCSETGANLMDKRYGIRGFYVHMPDTLKMTRKIYSIIEREVEADGHEPLLFPTVIPESNLKREEDHIEGFAPEVFWVTEAGDEELEQRYALRPTGETAFYPMYSKWVRSYRDLPFKRYQSRISVYRNETTSKPFLRGREFLFFETHDVFRDEGGALEQIDKDRKITQRVLRDRLCIPFIYFKRPQWDKFAGAKNTYTADTLMPDGRANQLGSTHNLGQNFAKAFDIKYENEDGEKKFPYQTCFGPGIWRIMAALVAIHGDDNGLVLPYEVATTQAVVVPIVFQDDDSSEEVLEMAREVKEKLVDARIRTKLDDSEKSPGEKFNHWDLKGVPIRVEIGPDETEEGKVTLAKRNSSEKVQAQVEDLPDRIQSLAEEMTEELKKSATEEFEEKIVEAEDYSGLKESVEEGMIVKAPFCSIDNDGERCAEKIKDDVAGNVRGTKMNSDEKPEKDDSCIVCGKEAKEIVYVSREY